MAATTTTTTATTEDVPVGIMFEFIDNTCTKDPPFFLATSGSAGTDMLAPYEFTIPSMGQTRVMMGYRWDIPKGYYVMITSRSGLAYNYGIEAVVGIIDSDYRGEISVLMRNHTTTPVTILKNQRMAQFLVHQAHAVVMIKAVSPLSSTARGEGGFGSTGNF